MSESKFQDKFDIAECTDPMGFRRSFSEVHTISRTALTTKGRMAWDLMQRFALIAGKLDGEDSTGRAKLDLLPPDQVVARACEITELAWAEFEKRDWMQALPPVQKFQHKD